MSKVERYLWGFWQAGMVVSAMYWFVSSLWYCETDRFVRLALAIALATSVRIVQLEKKLVDYESD